MKKVIEHKMCIFYFSLQISSETFLILRIIQRDFSIMYTDLHVKYPLFLSDLKWHLDLPDRFCQNIKISNFMKICPVGAELFHADGQT
jgi:hypothetical protein